ncbi:MAG: diaminopimelate epimerase [Woeseiaceae bacterium]
MINNPVFGTRPIGRFFIKMQGLHNHFVITDGRNERYRPDDDEIIRVCDVHTGVGGDQLVIIEQPTVAGEQGGATAFMRLLNVDAREVEACGNATRCVAWLLMQEQGTDVVILETLAGLIECRRTGNLRVSCSMGRISTEWQDVPLLEVRDTLHLDLGTETLGKAVALNIGNPHVVFFVDDLDAVSLEAVAPGIQSNPLFPDQVNVGLAQVVASDHMRLVVFERGAGLTTACGSGACVAVYAAQLRGLTSAKQMVVTMPAGDTLIEISDKAVATMTGPVAYCFSGYY